MNRQRTHYNAVLSLAQRAFPAFWAIAFRSSADSLAALARPPLTPPNLPRATAAGFFFRAGNYSGFFALAFSGAPINCSTTLSAFCATSPLLERLGMVLLCHIRIANCEGLDFKTAHYPKFGSSSTARL